MAENRPSEPSGEDLTKLEGLKEAKAGEPVKAKIVGLRRTVAGQVFGDKTKVRHDETMDQAMLRPTLYIKFEGQGFAGSDSYSIPDLVTPKSSLGLHKKRYGEYPFKDQEIWVHLNENGFYKIDH